MSYSMSRTSSSVTNPALEIQKLVLQRKTLSMEMSGSTDLSRTLPYTPTNLPPLIGNHSASRRQDTTIGMNNQTQMLNTREVIVGLKRNREESVGEERETKHAFKHQQDSEVMKAAKSLFCKRTRTLYHWLFPHMPKNKLKATISANWDTLEKKEKDFYISQVLGKFAMTTGSLMVNPQLGEFQRSETGEAVSNLLLAEEEEAKRITEGSRLGRPRRRRKMSATSTSSHSSGVHSNDVGIIKQIREEVTGEEFADDPELSKEFEQFKSALRTAE